MTCRNVYISLEYYDFEILFRYDFYFIKRDEYTIQVDNTIVEFTTKIKKVRI